MKQLFTDSSVAETLTKCIVLYSAVKQYNTVSAVVNSWTVLSEFEIQTQRLKKKYISDY